MKEQRLTYAVYKVDLVGNTIGRPIGFVSREPESGECGLEAAAKQLIEKLRIPDSSVKAMLVGHHEAAWLVKEAVTESRTWLR